MSYLQGLDEQAKPEAPPDLWEQMATFEKQQKEGLPITPFSRADFARMHGLRETQARQRIRELRDAGAIRLYLWVRDGSKRVPYYITNEAR